MGRFFGFFLAIGTIVFGMYYVANHQKQLTEAVTIEPDAPTPHTASAASQEPSYKEAREAHQLVNFAGPLAELMKSVDSSKVETLDARVYTPTAFDHVEGSVTGTSANLLHTTFPVAGIVQLPFQVPAHAATPQLRGTFQISSKPAAPPSSGGKANVDFLVLNDQQYSDFLQGRGSDAVFTVEHARNQQVDVSLPPAIEQATAYHLIFCSDPKLGKTMVQADFHIDF